MKTEVNSGSSSAALLQEKLEHIASQKETLEGETRALDPDDEYYRVPEDELAERVVSIIQKATDSTVRSPDSIIGEGSSWEAKLAAQATVDELLHICGSKETLAFMLESDIMNDLSTPLGWIIRHLSDEALATLTTTMPPLLSFLLKYVDPERGLSRAMMQDICGGCCIRNSQSLFRLFSEQNMFASYVHESPGSLEGGDSVASSARSRSRKGKAAVGAGMRRFTNPVAPTRDPKGKTYYFEIPDFVERMRIDGVVELHYVFRGTLHALVFRASSDRGKDWVVDTVSITFPQITALGHEKGYDLEISLMPYSPAKAVSRYKTVGRMPDRALGWVAEMAQQETMEKYIGSGNKLRGRFKVFWSWVQAWAG